jgi:GNAT superfamily N-acetyltransferase
MDGIRRCGADDLDAICEVINDGASAYRGVIPDDCWHEPYMPADELRAQIADGVEFWCYVEDTDLRGVMGIQPKGEVTLIRHAYVRTVRRQTGIGGRLLEHLRARTTTPILIGTWAAAAWAIAFYRKHGFELVPPQQTKKLLRTYWSIPPRQLETSVVLASSEF